VKEKVLYTELNFIKINDFSLKFRSLKVELFKPFGPFYPCASISWQIAAEILPHKKDKNQICDYAHNKNNQKKNTIVPYKLVFIVSLLSDQETLHQGQDTVYGLYIEH
jgi:hypothetical protein